MRGNFVGLPTDCPQRDERLGWTGDLQMFAPTAAFLYDCHGLLSSWLQDVAAEQLPDGTVPWFVPVIPGGHEWTPARPGAGWGDVVTLTPWAMHLAWNDPELLTRQYDSARAWVDLVTRIAGPWGLWNTGFQLGDWLDPAAPPEDPAAGRTDRYLIATAYHAWSADHLARIADVLGRKADRRRYTNLAKRVRRAFLAEYRLHDGRMTSDTPTAYAVAIEFDLLPDEDARVQAGQRLADLVAADEHTIQTGFIGTPLLAPSLTATGHLDSAYALLLQRKCPSWLYAIDQGATTTWERWDSLLPDGTVNPGGMTSFNPLRVWRDRPVAAHDGRGTHQHLARLPRHRLPAPAGWRPHLGQCRTRVPLRTCRHPLGTPARRDHGQRHGPDRSQSADRMARPGRHRADQRNHHDQTAPGRCRRAISPLNSVSSVSKSAHTSCMISSTRVRWRAGEHFVPVFRDENQMCVERENAMPACSDI